MERTFSWLSRCRRLEKNFERSIANEVLDIIRPFLILELKDIVAQFPENLTGISPIWIRPATYCTELHCPACSTKSSVFSQKEFEPVKDA